jgi:hypothetical protein
MIEQLDDLVTIVRPRTKAALAALLLALAAVVVWSLLARIPTNVQLPGVLVHGDGPVPVEAPVGGTVGAVTAADGSAVARGARLGTVVAADGRAVPLRAPAAGTVIAQLVRPGEPVAAGAAVVALDPTRRPLHALLVVASDEAAGLQPGMPVQLTAVAPQVYASLDGIVRSVDAYPATRADLAARFGSAELAPPLPKGRVRLVDVTLGGRFGDASYATHVPALVSVTATIRVATRRPISFVKGGV